MCRTGLSSVIVLAILASEVPRVQTQERSHSIRLPRHKVLNRRR